MTGGSHLLRRMKRLLERLLLIVLVWLVATMAAGWILGPWAGGFVTLAAVGWGAWEAHRFFAHPKSPTLEPTTTDE